MSILKNKIESIEFGVLKSGELYCEIIDLVADIYNCCTSRIDMFKVVKTIRDNPKIELCELLELGVLV